MVVDSKGSRVEGSAHADLVGKVYAVLHQNVRRCLICDRLFTRHAAAEHAGTVCHPQERDSGADRRS